MLGWEAQKTIYSKYFFENYFRKIVFEIFENVFRKIFFENIFRKIFFEKYFRKYFSKKYFSTNIFGKYFSKKKYIRKIFSKIFLTKVSEKVFEIFHEQVRLAEKTILPLVRASNSTYTPRNRRRKIGASAPRTFFGFGLKFVYLREPSGRGIKYFLMRSESC